MAIWIPDLADRRGPKYLQIVDALAEDIASGALAPGVKLLPHRELAYQLGVSPNTASRAYAEAINRALLRGEVGRGTFVRALVELGQAGQPADLQRSTSGPIDLSRNLPAPGKAAVELEQTLQELQKSGTLQALLDYQIEADLPHHTEAALVWLERSGLQARKEEIVITNGAQHGIFCTLMALMRKGDLLLTEELTYGPVRHMAERLGLNIASVRMDEGGLCPDALAEICRTSAAKALYFTPTLQSPTTLTLGNERRKAIAKVARRHDVVLIEDDVFGHLKANAPPPASSYAPDCSVYITSTAKCLSPGLRVGYVRAPAEMAAAISDALTLNCWMTPPLMAEIAARWILDGTADRLTAEQRQTASRRQRLARTVLDDQTCLSDEFGLHLWLKLPARWTPDAFRAEARRRGVSVTEGAAFAVSPAAAPHAVRLCLSHEPDELRLKSALETLRKLLQAPPSGARLIL